MSLQDRQTIRLEIWFHVHIRESHWPPRVGSWTIGVRVLTSPGVLRRAGHVVTGCVLEIVRGPGRLAELTSAMGGIALWLQVGVRLPQEPSPSFSWSEHTQSLTKYSPRPLSPASLLSQFKSDLLSGANPDFLIYTDLTLPDAHTVSESIMNDLELFSVFVHSFYLPTWTVSTLG